MNRTYTKSFLILLLVSLSLQGKVTSFLTKSGNMQYFISPVEFKSPEGSLLIDFTYLNIPDLSKNAVCNVTISSSTPIPELSEMFLLAENDTIPMTSIKLLYSEDSGKSRRFTAEVLPLEFQRFFSANTKQIMAKTSTSTWNFLETRKSKKEFKAAQNEIVFATKPNP